METFSPLSCKAETKQCKKKKKEILGLRCGLGLSQSLHMAMVAQWFFVKTAEILNVTENVFGCCCFFFKKKNPEKSKEGFWSISVRTKETTEKRSEAALGF